MLAPVSWELIEPAEGSFDFTLVDGLLRDARQPRSAPDAALVRQLEERHVQLCAAWVKRDIGRFPRAKLQTGETIEVLSTFAEANWQADARAFAALMQHLARWMRATTL